jgi:hypothetical protein
VPGKKIYVVPSPQLAAQVDRNSRSISFAPYVVLFARKILIPSKKAVEKLAENLEEDGTGGLRPETMKAMHASMAHGEDLEQTTHAVLKSLAPNLFSSKAITKTGRFKLFAWTKRVVTRASTDAVYGLQHNPFQFPNVEEDFW